jgi:hypothetical protein
VERSWLFEFPCHQAKYTFIVRSILQYREFGVLRWNMNMACAEDDEVLGAANDMVMAKD